jgi:acetylornithine/N-succinyldiaminopimelate aminotransferase
MLPGFSYVPFNDIKALEAAFTDEVAGVLIEPIQGEGGINVASREYMEAVRNLCDQYGALMILDEVQTGMGRTGKWFGFQHTEVEPDIMTMAKALGGGMAIGAMMAAPEVAKSLTPGKHASTFGGNSVACAAAVAVIEAIEDGDLLANAQKMGQYVREKLLTLKGKFSIIEDVRGIGLMIGMQLNISGVDIVNTCLDRGLRINCTQDTVIRLMPPMTVTSQQIDKAIDILEDVLKESTK